jgi:hypothetical protein|tara:strand:- start:222 stop:374 length:153 start_codon:yes stop_codon:yes gene_type:complete
MGFWLGLMFGILVEETCRFCKDKYDEWSEKKLLRIREAELLREKESLKQK